MSAAIPQHEEQGVNAEFRFTGEVRRLTPERPLETALKGGEGHRYEVELEEGQYVHLVADQRGINVVLRLRSPDGSLAIDSQTGDWGSEQLFAIPQTSDLYSKAA